MFKTAITTACIAATLALSSSWPAAASPQDRLEDRCAAAGGTMVDGSCSYPDGSTESCSGTDEAWACFRTPAEEEEEEPPTIRKKFPLMFDIERKVVKKPIPHGPMSETTRKIDTDRNRTSLAPLDSTTSTATPNVRRFSSDSVSDKAPKVHFSEKSTTLRIKR